LSNNTYNSEFFDEINEGSLQSAKIVVPLIIERFNPSSVIDFGCGTGAWLSVFKSNGVKEVLGLDGYRYDRCLLGEKEYIVTDLGLPYLTGKRFSLAMSLEVAEHLPESASDTFVSNIASAADAVLWSAATVGQGGTEHINEQPHEYWIDKFGNMGFSADTQFRKQLAHSDSVMSWYRDNIILFTRDTQDNI
jgi:hypothetical protein